MKLALKSKNSFIFLFSPKKQPSKRAKARQMGTETLADISNGRNGIFGIFQSG
jgi:hypothetical protein